MLDQLRELTESERIEARQTARENVIARYGKRPTRATYADHTDRPYPTYVVRTVAFVVLLVVVAFFAISAQRLYTIGSDTFGQTIPNPTSRLIAGVAVVIGSEAGALGFMLAAGVLARTRNERRTLYGMAFASTFLALVGNLQFAIGGAWRTMPISDPFAVVEAILPPVMVLGVGMVIERLWLDDISRHHANESAFRAALAEWEALTADPENSPYWKSAYATALRDAIRAVNASGRGKAERVAVMNQLTTADWRALVWREMQAEQWWHEPEPAAVQEAQDAHHATLTADGGNHARPLSDAPALALQTMHSTNGNGNHTNGNGHR